MQILEVLSAVIILLHAEVAMCETPNCCFQIVKAALHSKPGGDQILKEYEKTNCLADSTRRRMVNILVADMVESHG